MPTTKSAWRKPTERAEKKEKAPLPVSERLKRLFTSLCAQIDGGHFANAIKTCDKILILNPGDRDALQTKLFLHLQMEQYAAAISLIEDAADPESKHEFERAYSLYRLNKEDDAKEIVALLKDEGGGGNRGVMHLEAQLSYREGAFQAAFEIYNELLDACEPQSEEHSDILTNLQASQQQLDFINKGFLSALDALPTSLSANIESLPPPSQVTSSSTSAALASSKTSAGPSTDAIGSKGPAKKVRASRVPAGVIPGVTAPPDPERWLKKTERSTYGMGKKRKGTGGGGGATQGAAVSVESGTVASGGASHSTKSKGKKKK